MATRTHCDNCDATPAFRARRLHATLDKHNVQIEVIVSHADKGDNLELCTRCMRLALDASTGLEA